MSTRPLELRDGKVIESIRVGTIGLPYFVECTFCHVEYHAATYGEVKGWAESHYWTRHKLNEEKGQEVVASDSVQQRHEEPHPESVQSSTGLDTGNLPGWQREEFGNHEVTGGGNVVGEGRVAREENGE